jgi:hypothetical protein
VGAHRLVVRRRSRWLAALAGFVPQFGVDARGDFMQVKFELFKSMVKSWDTLCAEAAAFASDKGKERLITISISGDDGRGVIAVWYWE